MKFKKRHFPLYFLGILFLANQLGCMTARKSEQEQRRILAEKGGPEPRFGTYQVGNRQMHYTCTGSDSLPLVVMVHGSPGSSADMLDYLADSALLQHACVVAVDRPGFGDSGYGDAETSVQVQAADLLPLVQQFGRKKVIMVGHSYGGPVIARFAMDYPGMVDGLVLIAGSIDPELEPATWWKRPFDLPGIRLLVPSALRISNREILPLREELEKMRPDWVKITCPVTVIQGTKDRLVPAGNAAFAQKMLAHNPHVTIKMMENDDHFIIWSKKYVMVDAILERLQ
jgi:pimeloyl-ACP methyl ester carboxylesterase